jgi:putative flavoprotein involved in K+ transport
MPETIRFLERYAEVIAAPVRTHTTVTSVRRVDDGYEVATSQETWRCRAVVIATGACNIPNIPGVAEAVPAGIDQLTPTDYRNPDQLNEGGVLVVGAASTGTQIAEELQRSGRPVTLCAGEHIRMPRVYRGRDIEWWMDVAGVQDERYTEVDDINRARSVPSLQLAGSDDRCMLDLNRLSDLGVKLVGRLVGISDGRAQFSGSLPNQAALSDLKMNRLLDRIDEWVAENGLNECFDPPHRFEPTRVEKSPALGMDMTDGAIRTVLWATGYRPDCSWLHLPVFDRKGRIKHDGGVVELPGVYLMGMPFLRRRKSSLIDGAGDDARDLSAHLAEYLKRAGNGPSRSVVPPA